MTIDLPKEQPLVRALSVKLSVVEEEVIYQWENNGLVFRIIVPEGFVFDGASIPRAVWTPLGLAPHGVMDGPALLHDFLYHYKGKVPDQRFQVQISPSIWLDTQMRITRSLADELLYYLCVYFKIHPYRAWLVWVGVRAGGWFAWLRNAEKRKLKAFDELIEDAA